MAQSISLNARCAHMLAPIATAAALAALAAVVASTAVAADFDEAARLARLPADQRAIAERFIAFNDDMSAKYLARTKKINGEQTVEDRDFDDEHSLHRTEVARGPVIEKMGRMLVHVKTATPGSGDRELIFGRFYSLDMHPKTPLVGMLHAAIVLQFYANEPGFIGGWVDVMPGTRNEDDLASLKAVIDGVFAKYGADPAPWHKAVCAPVAPEKEKFHRQPSCSGVSFYGAMIFPGDLEKSMTIAMELYDSFTGAYMDVVEKRKDDPFTEADLVAQNDMRKRWLTDQVYVDPFSSKVVPFEVWSFGNVPPVIKF